MQTISDYCNLKPENFANGRDVRNYFEKTLVNQANRLSTMSSISDEDLCSITYEDVENVLMY